MRTPRVAWLAVLAPVLCAQTANVNSLVAAQRKQIETGNFRATGHLVRVDANGARTSYPFSIKARWFPGVLRVLAQVGQPSNAHREMRENVLLEMHPDGENTIRIANPGDAEVRILPFEKWTAHPLVPGFDYEDLIEQQYFWREQSSEGEEKFGVRDCDVVKSTPGPSDRTHYSSVKTWFDRTAGYPVYVEKTVKDTGAVKEFTSFGMRHEQGTWSARQIEVKTRGQAGSTLLIIDRGSARANLTIADFSPAQLTHFSGVQ